ncbi:hypothetical protein LX32DRAFT_644275, partial [Colletotrichum zoysiae]
MVFTFATLLFLPLSFLSSLFALDVASFLQTPNWAFVVIFLVSIAVSVLVALVAIYSEPISELGKNHLNWAISSLVAISEPISGFVKGHLNRDKGLWNKDKALGGVKPGNSRKLSDLEQAKHLANISGSEVPTRH